MDGASNATLENEFGTSNEEEAIKQILEKGTLQESEVRSPFPSVLRPPSHLTKTNANTTHKQAGERQGNKNDSMGARSGH